ncbi:MAG: nitroreductase family protein [Candidatus Thorarchaeota archaeon]
MEIPVDSWFNAINVRHSRRSYTGESIPEAKLHHLETISNEFKPFRGVRAVVVRDPPDNVFKGAIGAYGKVKNAPHFIAFIGDMTIPEVQEATGYLGEGIILEATSLDIQTCWVGGFFRSEVVTRNVEMQPNEHVIAITPIGYSPEKKSRTERTFSRFVRAHKRKPIEDLLIEAPVSYPYWMISALEAARLAPSAANRQPWRFLIEENSIIIRTDDTNESRWISKKLDCGIAMLHIELGARVNGVEGKWEFLSEPDVARYCV